MMKYKIFITKLEENVDFEKELEAWDKRRQGYMSPDNMNYPKRYLELPALDTLLTEEEFNKVRKACIEVM